MLRIANSVKNRQFDLSLNEASGSSSIEIQETVQNLKQIGIAMGNLMEKCAIAANNAAEEISITDDFIAGLFNHGGMGGR